MVIEIRRPRNEVGIAVGIGKGLLDSLRGREVGYRSGY